MKIELKNISIYERMSEETVAFCASLYIDGKKVGTAENEGKGGNTNYSWSSDGKNGFEENKRIIKEAEAYCLALPEKTVSYAGMEDFSMKVTLESVIDDLVTEELKRREEKKFKKIAEKKQDYAVVVYDKEGLYTIPFNGKRNGKTFAVSIHQLLQIENGRAMLQETITRALSEEGKEAKILNTNIPKEFFEKATVKG